LTPFEANKYAPTPSGNDIGKNNEEIIVIMPITLHFKFKERVIAVK